VAELLIEDVAADAVPGFRVVKVIDVSNPAPHGSGIGID